MSEEDGRKKAGLINNNPNGGKPCRDHVADQLEQFGCCCLVFVAVCKEHFLKYSPQLLPQSLFYLKTDSVKVLLHHILCHTTWF